MMMNRTHVTRVVRSLSLIVLLVFISCTTDYVTGKKTFSLVSESQEIAMGKEADPQIVAEYGLYEDEDLSTLVNELGQSLARVSHRPQLTYTFRIVDSPIINAFALPGGYVYMTRGILVHFNSEDELAGVLGHEIGHVVARHSAEQMSKQQLAGLGLGIGALVSEHFARYADFAGAGLSLLLLKYSRDQESESDMLGVEYSTKRGYDAHRMSEFFGTLESMRGDGGQSLPGFMSTHPDPGDRRVRVGQLADEWQQKIAYKPLDLERYEYLSRIDGIVYGDDPRQGYVDGQTFYHPTMRFQFPVPAGWDLANSASTVMMIDSEKKALIKLTLGRTESPTAEAEAFVTANKASVRLRQAQTVHGFEAVAVESNVQTQRGELWVMSFFIEKDDKIFVFHGFTSASLYSGYSVTFSQVMNGFERVTDTAVLNKKPQRVRIKKAPRSGELSDVLGAMGMDAEMFEAIALLNGVDPGARVNKGDWLKVVEE
jgi:predicted Zn-dependent protease